MNLSKKQCRIPTVKLYNTVIKTQKIEKNNDTQAIKF